MTIKDGTSDIVTRAHGLHVRAIREAMREADFVASTDAVDSYDEVIDQASWRLDRFKSNPCILYGHQSHELPIGQATRCAVVNGQLEVTIRFATAEANPRAEEVWLLVQQNVLRAVSVGFEPMDGKYEMREGKDVFVLYGCDLREVSVVAIPANHECLAKMKAVALADMGVCTIAEGWEAAMMAENERNPQMQERIRSAIAARDAVSTADNRPPITNIGGGSVGPHAGARNGTHIKTTSPAAPAGGLNTPDPATKEDPTMLTEAEIKSLQDGHAKALMTIAERDVVITAVTTDREKADALLAEKTAMVNTLITEKTALASEHSKACTDRDAATKKAAELEDKLIAFEVDALVGQKITAAEKDDFVALRKSSPDLFKSMVEKRAPMKLEEEITALGKKDGNPKAAGDTSDLAAEFRSAV